MQVKLVGPKVKFTGKTLWEIVGNLKEFGVGRLVFKSHFLNYPEPSYYKIVRVQPVEVPEDKYKYRRVMVWAEHVFRGKKCDELVQMHLKTHKTMFQLVPKNEEYKFLEQKVAERVTEIPAYREWPPMMKRLLGKEARRKGQELGLLKTIIVQQEGTVGVINEKLPPLVPRRPNLHSEFTVAELQQRLQALKSAVADKTTETTT